MSGLCHCCNCPAHLVVVVAVIWVVVAATVLMAFVGVIAASVSALGRFQNS